MTEQERLDDLERRVAALEKHRHGVSPTSELTGFPTKWGVPPFTRSTKPSG